MRTTIMVHGGPDIRAEAGTTVGAPLNISVHADGNVHEMTAFTADFTLSRKLADAINATVREHNAELAAVEPSPVEEAA